jgi:BON domain
MRRFMFGFAMLTIVTCLPLAAKADQQQDKQIAQEVISRLQQEKSAGRLKGFSIDLQVEDGTLWLSGRVTSKDQQDKALDVARRVPGVKQVVNDLSVVSNASQVKPASATSAEGTQSVLIGNKTFGSGAKNATASTTPVSMKTVQPTAYGAEPAPLNYGQPTPGYVQQGSPRPVAFAPSQVNYQGGGYGGQPQPMYMPSSGMGAAPARYDQPQMPSYAWPSYASAPNYGAVTYPKQYSASAWPYIGPFYPYPQVPLGWRKVSLEWDDGWWFLDFKDRR